MIQRSYLITSILLLLRMAGMGQTDTINVNGFIGLRGMWQTGNLNQINLMPNGKMWLSHPNHYMEISGNYHFIKVDGFEAKNDLWFYGLYQRRPQKRFFPSFHTIAGFAVSFKIDRSVVTGVGGGMNIIRRGPQKYFQFHLHGSYLNFQFKAKPALRSFALGSLFRANIPVNKWLLLGWELASYHSMETTAFWGGGNLFQLIFHLAKNFSVNLSHQTYYNHQTATDIEQTNTQLLFGLQYSFH